jgi:MerR family transcriptional regulator/heat shock protein HspR
MNFDDFDTAPVFAISVVAQLTGMHPQTLRQYDRVGLVTPKRTSGGGRRYSARDIERLREIQHLSGEGIGLTGVRRILDLERLADELQARVRQLEAELESAHRAAARPQHDATPGSDVVLRDRAAVVVWRRPPRTTL